MIGNISKVRGKLGATGPQGPQGPQGEQGLQGEKGDTPVIAFRLDENTGDLYYSSDGIYLDKEYVDSNNLVTKEELEKLGSLKEDVVNKVDVIDMNGNNISDTHYPSVRAVYDFGYGVADAAKQELRTFDIATLSSEIAGLRSQMSNEAHFKGYLSTDANVKALKATPNDFAYSAESGTKWVYDAKSGWVDTGNPVPDQLTPASETTPLINGTASVGAENAYARGDHRHPTDITRLGVTEFNEFKSELETGLDNIIAIQNRLIGGDNV